MLRAAAALLALLLAVVPGQAAQARGMADPPLSFNLRVDVGGYKLYLQCVGAGTPTVILDNEQYLDPWDTLQQQVGSYTRTCAYDREGMGLSGFGPTPITSAQLARDVHRLLVNSGLPGPFILVGNSFGGTTMRLVASRYPQGVAGAVLLDPVPAGLLSSRTVYASLGVSLTRSKAQLESAGSLGKLPLVVLSHRVGLTLPLPVEHVWKGDERPLARLSSNSLFIVADDSGYAAIPNLQTSLATAAILQVIEAARTPGRQLAPCGFWYVARGGVCG